jgi:hypothetical protein
MEIFGELNLILVLALIAGLVEFAKRLGVTGNGSLVLSMILGVAFGLVYQLSLAIPITTAGWFAAVVYGLLTGLAASGLYDLGKRYSGS